MSDSWCTRTKGIDTSVLSNPNGSAAGNKADNTDIGGPAKPGPDDSYSSSEYGRLAAVQDSVNEKDATLKFAPMIKMGFLPE